MMLPRLYIGRNLLREDGVIFVSCDDNEVHNLRSLMNEVFGEENFLGVIVWKGATDNNPTRSPSSTSTSYAMAARKQLRIPSGRTIHRRRKY